MPSLTGTNAPAATLLIRVMVGGIFLSEGVQKFIYPEQLASGRFERIGIPAPEVMGPFVATVECTCGLMILFGLLCQRCPCIHQKMVHLIHPQPVTCLKYCYLFALVLFAKLIALEILQMLRR